MDVGYYLGELLMQSGEVKVSGLGSFSLVRMSACYNANEQQFYPPYYTVKFNSEANGTDEELAGYLVTKKGISLASAKYFIEKYIAALKEQAIEAGVPLGDLGTFSAEGNELTFNPNNKSNNSPDFYGYAPLKVFKAGATPEQAQEAPVTPQLVYPPVTTPDAEVTPPVEEKKYKSLKQREETTYSPAYEEASSDTSEDEVESKGPLRAILIAAAIIVVIAGGLFALYAYQPDTFEQLQFWRNDTADTPVKARPNTIVIPEIDSANTDTAQTALNDTLAKAADTVRTNRFELISGKGFKNLWGADQAVKKYKKMGLKDAKLLEELPGNLIKVSVASFNSVSESEALRQKLIKEGKISKNSYTLELPQQ